MQFLGAVNHTTHALPALQVNTAALKLQRTAQEESSVEGNKHARTLKPQHGVMWSARPRSLHFSHRANDVLFSSSIFSTSLATCCSLPCCLSFVESGCTDIRTPPQTRNHAYQKPRPTQSWYLLYHSLRISIFDLRHLYMQSFSHSIIQKVKLRPCPELKLRPDLVPFLMRGSVPFIDCANTSEKTVSHALLMSQYR